MISLFKNHRLTPTRIILLVILAVVLFFLFDRAVHIHYKNISSDFYSAGGKDAIKTKVSAREKHFYDTLIIGSSRTRRGIHPLYLKNYLGLKAYTNAGDGKYLKNHYHFYRIFRKKYRVPDYLIFGIDYFIFKKISNPDKLRPIIDLLNGGKRSGVKLTPELLNVLSNPSLIIRDKENINAFINDYLKRLSEQRREEEKEPAISEYVGTKKTANPKSLREPRHWRKNEYARYPGLEGEYLDMLLDELEKDKVRVFLVLLPDLINVYRTNFEHEMFTGEMRAIAGKYSNITILDYNSPEKFDLSDPLLFWDGQYGVGVSHLSFYGAELFNRMLSKDIKKILESERSR